MTASSQSHRRRPSPVEPSPAPAPSRGRGQAPGPRDHLLQRRPREDVGRDDPGLHRRRHGRATKVFVTFWGLQTFVKDRKRITGENWMQKMMSMMQRPGHHPPQALQDELPGHGPVDDAQLAKKYNVASPTELLEVAQTLGVEFIPCQMTMDMFGLKREDLIEGMGEPVGAATVIAPHDRGRRAALHLRPRQRRAPGPTLDRPRPTRTVDDRDRPATTRTSTRAAASARAR